MRKSRNIPVFANNIADESSVCVCVPYLDQKSPYRNPMAGEPAAEPAVGFNI